MKETQMSEATVEFKKIALMGSMWLLLIFWPVVTYYTPKLTWRITFQTYNFTEI